MSVYLYIQMYLQVKMYMIQCIKMWGVDMNKKENNIIIRIEKDKKELFKKKLKMKDLQYQKFYQRLLKIHVQTGRYQKI